MYVEDKNENEVTKADRRGKKKMKLEYRSIIARSCKNNFKTKSPVKNKSF